MNLLTVCALSRGGRVCRFILRHAKKATTGPGGLNPVPTDPFMPTAESSAVGICLPAERLRMYELEEENRARLPPDA